MDTTALFSHATVTPLAQLGLVGQQYELNIDTLIYSWGGMAALFFVVWYVRAYHFNTDSLLYTAVEYVIESFASMCVESLGYFRYDYFAFITSMFLFTFSGCVISMLPYMGEAAKDPNTTFALSLFCFFYVSYQHVRQEGVGSYLKHFLGHEQMPMVMRVLMMPLETMGQLSRIISMAFRLFGNVLGGAVVYHVIENVFTYYQAQFVASVLIGGFVWVVLYRLLRIGYESRFAKFINMCIQFLFVLTWIQVFFGVFEALIQSFVISMLSLTYLTLAVHHDLKHDSRGVAWH